MLTPAEIIAARHNGIVLDSVPSTAPSAPVSAETTSTQTSISDETAFPTLGGGKSSPSPATPLWGPSMQPPKPKGPQPTSNGAQNGTQNGSNDDSANGDLHEAEETSTTPARVFATPALSSSRSSTPVKSVPNKFKTTTIQEAFSLDVQDQLNVAKPEFIKILTAVKTETKTNIECTTSQHIKKRTFLITGKAEDVKLAKRLVIKKLTKPVVVTFSVPAKLLSRIIGPQGKTLKPIIAQNEVRIDIGNEEESEREILEDDDDIFAKTVKITIEGDVEGCKHAKAQILAIVKEETKNLSAKITVSDDAKPFAGRVVNSIISQYPEMDVLVPDYKSASNRIVLVGGREDVIEAKQQIKQALAELETKTSKVEVAIPALKHQFLPIDTILQSHDVLIKLPLADESNVTFIGEKSKIAAAQEEARKHTSQYKVEVLDMSKAHRGNLEHVRAVAQYLDQSRFFHKLAQEHAIVVNTPSVDISSTSIPIEIVSKADDAEKVKAVKRAIVNQVNKITPDQTHVVSDIDEFLIKQVPSTIADAAKENKVDFVVIGNTITLLSNEEVSDDFDFVDNSAAFEKVDASLNKLRELAANLKSIVIAVPSAEQQHISGPNNTTLNAILAEVANNNVTVKLHHPSEDEVTVHGVKADVDHVQKEIEQVLADAHEHKDGYKDTVSVPSNVLSRLIGRGGASMNALRQEFGIKIDVADEEESKANVVLNGAKRNVERAKAHILLLSKKWADETLVRLRVENQYHRRMIGAGGVYINRLKDKYNVQIRFPAQDALNVGSFSDLPSNKDEVTIKGPSKGVAKAEEELKELLKYEMENGFKEVMQVPTKAIAHVIGKNGETIKDIADGSGVEYSFKKGTKEKELGYAEVELTGSKAALKEATNKIKAIISEVENTIKRSVFVPRQYHRELIGSGGRNMKEIILKAGGDALPRQKQHRLLSIPNENSDSEEVTSEGDKKVVDKVIAQVESFVERKESIVSEDFELAKEKHRFIVGPGGSIRHALQDEFDASIEIPRPNDDSTIVKLAALPEQLTALKAKIAELTKDDWKIQIDIPEHLHTLVSERGAIFNKLQSDFGVEVAHGNLTRKAAKLSSAPIPTPPSNATPENDSATLFTISVKEPVEETAETIPWRLKGDKVEKAAAVIRKRLENAEQASSNGWFYSSDPAVFSKIIGNRGQKVNQIRDKTGTFITVPRKNDKYANIVYLVGTEESLEAANAEIKKILG